MKVMLSSVQFLKPISSLPVQGIIKKLIQSTIPGSNIVLSHIVGSPREDL